MSQIHSPHLHVGVPGIFSDLLRSVQMLKRESGYGKQRQATTPIQSLIKLQPSFLSLRWKTCFRLNCSLGSCACSEGSALGQNTLMKILYIYIYIYLLNEGKNVIYLFIYKLIEVLFLLNSPFVIRCTFNFETDTQ